MLSLWRSVLLYVGLRCEGQQSMQPSCLFDLQIEHWEIACEIISSSKKDSRIKIQTVGFIWVSGHYRAQWMVVSYGAERVVNHTSHPVSHWTGEGPDVTADESWHQSENCIVDGQKSHNPPSCVERESFQVDKNGLFYSCLKPCVHRGHCYPQKRAPYPLKLGGLPSSEVRSALLCWAMCSCSGYYVSPVQARSSPRCMPPTTVCPPWFWLTWITENPHRLSTFCCWTI